LNVYNLYKKEPTTWELYDLKNDPSEKNNVIDRQKKRVDAMRKILMAARTKNENWDFPKE
jgi:predicted RNA-binding protein YlqC (UPF0109 family)